MITKLLPQRLNRFVEHQLPGITPEISSTEGQFLRSSLLPHGKQQRAPFCQSLPYWEVKKPSHDRANRSTAWLTQGPVSSSALASPLFSKNPGKSELYEEIISGEGEGGGEE